MLAAEYELTYELAIYKRQLLSDSIFLRGK